MHSTLESKTRGIWSQVYLRVRVFNNYTFLWWNEGGPIINIIEKKLTWHEKCEKTWGRCTCEIYSSRSVYARMWSNTKPVSIKETRNDTKMSVGIPVGPFHWLDKPTTNILDFIFLQGVFFKSMYKIVLFLVLSCPSSIFWKVKVASCALSGLRGRWSLLLLRTPPAQVLFLRVLPQGYVPLCHVVVAT